MNISVIIPNYNGAHLLEKNIPKLIKILKEYNKGKSEIIILDDSSKDNSVEIIEKLKESSTISIIFIQNEKNLGFSPSINRGVKIANGEIVLLLNSDAVPQNDFLNSLIPHFSNQQVFGVGCMDKSIEKEKVVWRGRGIGTFEKGFLMHRRGETDRKDTLWVNGGSGAFRKSIWELLGGFDELYTPFYWEDIDLSYRALKSGYQILFEPKSIVIHEHERGAIKSNFTFFQVQKIAYRNMFIFVWKNVTDVNLELQHLFWLPYHFLKAFIRNDTAFFSGFTSAVALILKILRKRVEVQKSFVKSDSEVVKPFIDETKKLL